MQQEHYSLLPVWKKDDFYHEFIFTYKTQYVFCTGCIYSTLGLQ